MAFVRNAWQAVLRRLPTRRAHRVAMVWVGVGAGTGGLISGCDKIGEITFEKEPEYVYPLIERPIRVVYHTTRVAGHAGWGAGIGGFTAATAPVTIPFYMYWRSCQDEVDRQKQN